MSKTERELNEWREWGEIAARVLDYYRIYHEDISAAAVLRAMPIRASAGGQQDDKGYNPNMQVRPSCHKG